MMELPPSPWHYLGKTPLARCTDRKFHQYKKCVSPVHILPSPKTHSGKRLETFWTECFCTQCQGGRKTSDKPLRMLVNTAAIPGKFIYCLIKTWYIETWICKSPGGFASSPRSCRKWKTSRASCKAPMHWALMAAGNAANPDSLPYRGAAQWDLGQEPRNSSCYSAGEQSQSPTSSAKKIFLPALDQTQKGQNMSKSHCNYAEENKSVMELRQQ